METNNLFSNYQSGFRKNYSCETSINYIVNEWKRDGKQKKIMALFLDFKRAFETIDRETLLEKMCKYGIEHKELAWFRSYLTQRTQRTKIHNKVSNSINVEIGVPQGSILGALLFIIYINDMPRVISSCKISLYADDTLIYSEGKNERECKTKLMTDIARINKWLKMNKLKLNEQKTKLIEINMNSEENIEINGEIIEKVNSIKYLGVIIDKELKFQEHVEIICNKIGFFKRILRKIDIMTAINIYNVMIKPHFEYCSSILYSCCSATELERLQKLQNKAMRSILKCNRFTSIRLMMDTLKWLSIKQRLKLNTLLLVFKLKSGKAPQYLTGNIMFVREAQPHQLRNANDFRIQLQRTTAAQNSLFHKGLLLYNTLPADTKYEENFIRFKRKCIEFVKSNS